MRGLIRSMAATALVAIATSSCDRMCFAASHEREPKPEGTESATEPAADVAMRGVEVGEFRIRSYYPIEAQKSRVRFVLYAAANVEHYADLQALVESHRQKIRDQVITATRMAPLANFDEPELTSLRRLILVRLQRSLPELPISEIYVSEFQLTVKSL